MREETNLVIRVSKGKRSRVVNGERDTRGKSVAYMERRGKSRHIKS